jgi:hypothetical protein
MNLKSEFRVFINLWILYALTALFYPFHLDQKDFATAIVHRENISSSHGRFHGNQDRDLSRERKICDAKAEESMKDVGLGRNCKLFWEICTGTCCGLCLLRRHSTADCLCLVWPVVKTGLWVATGFRQGSD